MKLRAIVYLDSALADGARSLAAGFEVSVIDGSALAQAKAKHLQQFLIEQTDGASEAFVFVLDASGLALHALGEAYGVSIRADFHGSTVTYRRKKGGGKGQMIAKAVGLHSGIRPTVLDATAGLGGDGFVLASLGCEVTLLERVSEVRALLASGLAQAKNFAVTDDPELLTILERIQLMEADSLSYLAGIREDERPDVIYLDPMFPEPGKRAMVKKEMRVFHELVGQDSDADQLLDLALAKARYRVVVKRPRIAPTLNNREPSHSLAGKSNRYDIYTIRKMPERGLKTE
jgi:16S rRNA (guanine1516-N2)-methyltransferase